MMKITALLSLFLWQYAASAQPAPRFLIDVPYTDSRTISGETIVLYTHPTSTYDFNGVTKDGILAVNKWASAAGLPQILLFSADENNPHYFLASKDVSLTVGSGAGQHLLKFAGTKTIISAGGNFGLCLCESLRDSLVGTGSGPIQIVLVTDAIYDNVLSMLDTSRGAIADWLKKMPAGNTLSLEQVRRSSTAGQFLEFVRDRIVASGKLCPLQGEQLDLMNIRILIKSGSDEISVGTGDREVVLELLSSKNL